MRQKSMKLTQTQRNTMRIVKGVIDKSFARMVAQRKRYTFDDLEVDDQASKALDSMFTHIAGLSRAPSEFNNIGNFQGGLLKSMVHHVYTNTQCRFMVEKAILADLYAHAAEYELLAQMPQERRPYVKRGPRSLVERRAERVESKVVEWERKLKYAKTKLAAYRKKQKYYAKKGAVNA
jgi:hypothetical protein